MKGLEPEIQRLIAQHKTELKKVKSIHEAELLEADERASQRYVRQIEELRDQLAGEKEAACGRERQLAKESYVFLIAVCVVWFRICPTPLSAVQESQNCNLMSTNDNGNLVTEYFLADHTNGRAIGTLLCLSSCLFVVCDVMYCG